MSEDKKYSSTLVSKNNKTSSVKVHSVKETRFAKTELQS